MHNVTDEEVDFILDDIKARGVVLEDLQYNLLDHMCCIIENEMPESENFYKFYESMLPRFFKTELKELQEEVDILLQFKHYYAMKKTLKIVGIIASVLILLGSILKILHKPGASVALILGGMLFSFLFLPLMIILKFRDEENAVDKWVLSTGFLLAIGMSVGIIFKLMRWDYAQVLMVGGVVLFVFVYVPLYFFTRIQRPELKFNTIVNSVLMMCCGGMLFALFNLNHIQSKDTNHKIKKSETSEISNLTERTLFTFMVE